jgi:pilus assembly protein CpaC
MSTSMQRGWSFGIRSIASWAALLVAGAVPLAAQTSAPGNPDQAEEIRDSEPVFHVIAPENKISVVHLQSRILEFSKRIKEVDGFNPEILNVTPVSPTQIRLRAETTGVTSMTIKDETDQIFTVEVLVEGDVRELNAYLRRLFPGSAIDVVSLRDSVVLRGWVTDPQSIPQIMAIARQMYPTVHNQMQVGGVNVVQLHVKILEVQRSKVKELGFNFVASGQKYALGSTVGGLVPLTGMTVPFGGPPVPSVGAALNSPLQFAITGNSDRFQGFVDALTNEALAKVLAEPTLVTTSGRPASLLSGGEFPILVPAGVGTVSVQFREFGVRMEAIPTVLGNGRLRLDVAPEFSERDFSSSVTVGGLVVPGINTRRINTQVEMNFGETIMIGGLISRKRLTTSTKIPIIGELPVIGAAFSRKTHEMGETELLIMVTPEMAGAMRPDQVPHEAPGWLQDEPTSKELFLDGMLEVPSYGSDCEVCQNCQPGMIHEGAAQCAPPENRVPVDASPLVPDQELLLLPTDPPAGEIQTMSGRSGDRRVIQAGGTPFRIPTRREIPASHSSTSKSKSDRAGSSDDSGSPTKGTQSRALPGLIGPMRPNSARPTGSSPTQAPAPKSVRDLAP